MDDEEKPEFQESPPAEPVETNSEAASAEEKSDGKDEKSISADLIRGHINTIILRALYDGDKYGYEIIAEIESKSHGQYSMKQPSLYSALKRLESQGYITSYWGGTVGGGRRKYFSLTEEGRTISERNQSEWEYSRTVIDSLISDRVFDFNNPAPTAVDMRVLKGSTTRVPGRDDKEEGDEEEDETSRLHFEEERIRLETEFAEQRAALERDRAEAAEERERILTELREREETLEEERRATQAALEEKEKELEERQEHIRELREEQIRQEEELRKEKETVEQELLAKRQEIASARDMYTLEEEHRRAQLDMELDAKQRILDDKEKSLKEESDKLTRRFEEREHALQDKWERAEAEIAERERQIRLERERCEKIHSERELLEQRIAERDQWLAEQRDVHARELEELEARIREEEARKFSLREKQLRHENYLNLVNTPPNPERQREEERPFYTAPVAVEEETTAEEDRPAPIDKLYGASSEPVEDRQSYRSVVHRMYESSIRTDTEPLPEEEPEYVQSASLGAIDFGDLEARAARDGIKINTSGGLSKDRSRSDSIVHKGKALFLSAIVVFCICIVEGSLVLALSETVAFPLFYPYFIWAVGLAVLLITGLAYANHYGEKSLRGTGMVLPTAIVVYLLLAIFTLVIALAVKIDFGEIGALATFVIVPCVFFLNIVAFAGVYALLVKPKK